MWVKDEVSEQFRNFNEGYSAFLSYSWFQLAATGLHFAVCTVNFLSIDIVRQDMNIVFLLAIEEWASDDYKYSVVLDISNIYVFDCITLKVNRTQSWNRAICYWSNMNWADPTFQLELTETFPSEYCLHFHRKLLGRLKTCLNLTQTPNSSLDFCRAMKYLVRD